MNRRALVFLAAFAVPIIPLVACKNRRAARGSSGGRQRRWSWRRHVSLRRRRRPHLPRRHAPGEGDTRRIHRHRAWHDRGVRARPGHRARRRRRRQGRLRRRSRGEAGPSPRHRRLRALRPRRQQLEGRGRQGGRLGEGSIRGARAAPRRRERRAPGPHRRRRRRELQDEDPHRQSRHRGREPSAQDRAAQHARLRRPRADGRHHPDAHRRDGAIRERGQHARDVAPAPIRCSSSSTSSRRTRRA